MHVIKNTEYIRFAVHHFSLTHPATDNIGVKFSVVRHNTISLAGRDALRTMADVMSKRETLEGEVKQASQHEVH